MSPDISLATLLDVLIAGLLAATIAYAVALNRKLARLRSDRGEMEALIARLIDATEAAQKGLESLRGHAKEVGARLQKDLEGSQSRADELSFLIERAEAASRRLETAIAAVPAARPADASGSPRKAEAKAKPSAEEAVLLKTLQGIR